MRLRNRLLVGLVPGLALVFSGMGVAHAAPEIDEERVLNVYNWEDYLGPDTIAHFEERYGIKVNLATFDDEDVMVSSIQSDPGAYDIIITSGRLIAELIDMRLLARLDLSRIPNLANIEPRFRNPAYDPGNVYSLPYMWGTTAMAVNTAHVKEDPETWAVLWNPAYAGKIAMLPSGPEVVGAALKLLGYSLNSTDPKQLEEAGAKLLEQRPLLAGYVETIETRDKLSSGELWAAQVYVGEGLVAAKNNPEVRYVIPKEGATLWVDNLAVPRDAAHKKNAELFINFILEPAESAAISNHLMYANPNSAARMLSLPELTQSPALYPPADVLSKCEVLLPTPTTPAGEARQQSLNRTWAELQRN